MNELLQRAVHAHGGLGRWDRLKTLESSISMTGTLWNMKSQTDVLRDIRVEAELQHRLLTAHIVGQDSGDAI